MYHKFIGLLLLLALLPGLPRKAQAQVGNCRILRDGNYTYEGYWADLCKIIR